jgi:hypothetical protein
VGEKTGGTDQPLDLEPGKHLIRLEPPAASQTPRGTGASAPATSVRIGSLEVRIVLPDSGKKAAAPAVAPPRPAPPARPGTLVPPVRLARGFGSFGLAQG